MFARQVETADSCTATSSIGLYNRSDLFLRLLEQFVYALASPFCLSAGFSESIAPHRVADVYAHLKDNPINVLISIRKLHLAEVSA